MGNGGPDRNCGVGPGKDAKVRVSPNQCSRRTGIFWSGSEKKEVKTKTRTRTGSDLKMGVCPWDPMPAKNSLGAVIGSRQRRGPRGSHLPRIALSRGREPARDAPRAGVRKTGEEETGYERKTGGRVEKGVEVLR